MKKKILIVTAQYYPEISKNLKKKAFVFLKTKIKKSGGKIDQIDVPGVFEIPVVISKNIKKYDGFIALGCVIKGETPHFQFISQATTDAIMKISIDHKKPIGNGIITCLNKEQAFSRFKKKGQEAADAVLSVLNIF